MSASVADDAVQRLRDLGAIVKLSKQGKVLIVDFRPVSERVSNDVLLDLQSFDRLKELYLTAANITDAGLEHLVALGNLTLLDLQQTKITDRGLQVLERLPALKLLLLSGTQISRERLNQFRRAMLNTRVVFL